MHSPTIPNRTQYIAAYIGSGMDAKKAPNFPEKQVPYDQPKDNKKMVILFALRAWKTNQIWKRKARIQLKSRQLYGSQFVSIREGQHFHCYNTSLSAKKSVKHCISTTILPRPVLLFFFKLMNLKINR